MCFLSLLIMLLGGWGETVKIVIILFHCVFWTLHICTYVYFFSMEIASVLTDDGRRTSEDEILGRPASRWGRKGSKVATLTYDCILSIGVIEVKVGT